MLDNNDNLTLEKTEDLEQLEARVTAMRNSMRIVWKDVNHKGKALNTYENFKLLCAHYGITIKYNEMTKDTEIDIPNELFCKDIERNTKLTTIISLANKQELSDSHVKEYVLKLSNENVYHPVRDWIDMLQWDGKDRLPEFYNLIETDGNEELKKIIMRKWVLSLVAALYHPNFSSEGVLTLIGEQGVGKTEFVSRLIPREYRYRWNKDGVVIDTKNKDTIIQALAYWICELGEVDATFKKSDIAHLKAFLTSAYDEFRRPYAAAAEKYPRRTIFYATVNDEEFLRDDENRRFWVISVTSFKEYQIDIEQLWAQMKHEYEQIKDKITTPEDRKKNQQWGWFLSPDEKQRLRSIQELHKVIDPVAQQLDNRLKLPTDINTNAAEWLNATAICEKIGITNINKSHTNQASKWLKSKGYQRKKDTKQYQVEFKDSEFFETNKDHVKVIGLPKRTFTL